MSDIFRNTFPVSGNFFKAVVRLQGSRTTNLLTYLLTYLLHGAEPFLRS
jgi:hypothetical protein